MNLTDYESEMLAGKNGRFKQKALENVISYAHALGAERLCRVSKATLFLGAHPYLEVMETDDYEKIFSQMHLCAADEVISMGRFDDGCFCQTCSAPSDQYRWKELHMTQEQFQRNQRFLEITRDAGVSITGSCTPYLIGWIPLMGEHFVSTESSNILMCNSVFGACGNADGIEATTWSAICGRTPEWGMHTKQARKGNIVFRIECPSSTSRDWDIIGFTVGRILPPHGVPVLTGDFERPDLIRLKQCFAAMATTSGAEMCHIVGITPEAPTVDVALGKKEPDHMYTVDRRAYDESVGMLCDPGSQAINLVTLGCPHYSLEEIRDAATYLQGKRIQAGMDLFIWTDYATREMAVQNGYEAMVRQAGGHIVTSGCPLLFPKSCWEHVRGIAADGAKQAHYMRSEFDVPIYYGSMAACVDAAVDGCWTGER